MATANPADDRARDRSGDGDRGADPLATKVVVLELFGAPRPLTAAEIQERTALAELAVLTALETLAHRNLGEWEDPGGDREPRFRLDATAGASVPGRAD